MAGPDDPSADREQTQVASPEAPPAPPTPKDASIKTGESSDEDPPDAGVSRWAIAITTGICALSAALGHGVLWWAYSEKWVVPWQPVTGIALVIVETVSFGGFYYASRRARVAIASSFLLTFLVSLTYIFTITAFAEATQGQGAKDLFDDFRSIVTVIIGFYFGSEAAISVAKAIGVSRAGPGMSTAIQTSDRDLVSPSPTRR